ncbi:metallophosphoesterase [Longimicrobium sp.]|uniref:metallophosphoesterase n=1 Tax=Longimicrobium sp. TaxID=2029185 RepID=UPI002BB53F53|nr:metallophosphoesterase [Longimicrobium sp.]HSU12656.1 metallophosphoesterase [Longimicrobium sp.]
MPGTRRPLAAAALLALALAACNRGGRQIDLTNAQEDSAAENPAQVYGVAAARNVVVTPVEIEVPELPPGWSGLKIAAISDFQLGLWPDNERVALAAAQAAAGTGAELIVLLGDYVARGDDYAAIDRVLAPLKGRTVMAVLGTADETEDTQGNPDSARIKTVAALERSGVKVLRDAFTRFSRGGDTAFVVGLEPYLARRADWKKAEIFNALPDGPHAMLALAHMPVTAATVPEEKFPVILSGHTFCGPVEVPGTPRLAWFNTTVLPGTRDPAKTRIWRLRGSTLFATCGIGYSYVPVRFGHPPEVALITLRAVGPAPAKADSAKAQQANVDSLIQVFQQRDTTKGDSAGATP